MLTSLVMNSMHLHDSDITRLERHLEKEIPKYLVVNTATYKRRTCILSMSHNQYQRIYCVYLAEYCNHAVMLKSSHIIRTEGD